jgi:GTP-binding protein
MIIDDVTIKVKAGHGGKGAVAFNTTKLSLGPTGADGGLGGSVYLEGTSDLGSLIQFRYKKEAVAQDGENGKSQFRDGATGEDIILKIPVGTIIHNLTTGEEFEIIHIEQKVKIAEGGKGGRGNFKFRSSRNTSPTQSQGGLPGEEFDFRFELKLIADIGFVGLPNVGKSSLLNELTNANSKVANYHFTTLDPHLGVYYELVLADIPGIIEGASEGKGLGIKFLKHIDRTKVIFHFISAESKDLIKDYEVIRKELGCHNKELLEKDEYILLTKIDLLDKKEIDKKVKELKKKNKKVFPISIIDEESIKELEKVLREIIKEKYFSEEVVEETEEIEKIEE